MLQTLLAQKGNHSLNPANEFDAVIIGAGPAGLTAATYLGRFHRKPLVIDGGDSRARWIPESHNIPGFARGLGGGALLQQMREQALQYGAEILPGYATAVERSERGFRVRLGEQIVSSRFVLLNTGVRDVLPELQGAEEAVLRSVLRFCPICDAFEATGKRIAVIGSGAHAAREARFLRTYSDRVTLIHLGTAPDPELASTVRRAGVALTESTLDGLRIEPNGLALRTPDGLRFFDVVYAALGCTARTSLAADLEASLDENGALRVNANQQTSVPGLYAAGDIVRGLNQVVVAAAEAAIAATDIHNRLRDG